MLLKPIPGSRWVIGLLGLLACVAPAFGQPATDQQRAGVVPKPDYKTLHLETNLGSYKLLDGEGRVEISFTGTILISQLRGTLSTSGRLKKEYEDKGRAVYFGKGQMTITGTFRAIQWFGRDMKSVWYGKGIARLSGEFDRNLNVGKFWYDDPKNKFEWQAQGSVTITLPDITQPPSVLKKDQGPTKPKPKGKP